MTFFSFFENRFKLCLIGLLCIVSILVLITPIVPQPDSLGYIEMWFNRTPVYPLFVNGVEAIFGSNFKTPLKFLQLIFGMLSVWFFIVQMRKNIQLQAFWYLLLAGILVIPYVYNHKIANTILTEAIAYPLYLIVCIQFLLYFFNHNRKHITYGILFLLVLLLTRKQFIFFIPVLLVMVLWVSYQTKTFKKHLPHLVTLVLLPFLISLADSTYHKVAHGYFTNTPWTGIHLLAPAMYVADEEDVTIYTSEDEKAYFTEIYNSVSTKQYNQAAAKAQGEEVISHYVANFAKIANHTIYPIGKERYEKQLSEDDALIKIDNTTTAMAFPLIKDNFKKWFSLFIKNFSYGFENSKYVLLFVILFFFGISKLKNNQTNIYKAIAFVTCITISNMAVVAVGMHTLKRFIFYNDWVLFFILFMLLATVSNQLEVNKKATKKPPSN